MGSLDLDLVQTPLADALAEVADQSGVSITCPAGREKLVVEGTFRRRTVGEVLRAISPPDLEPVMSDGSVVFVALTDARVPVMVELGTHSPEVVSGVVTSIAPGSPLQIVGGRLVVMASRKAATQIAEVLPALLGARESWRVEVTVYQVGTDVLRDVGLDLAYGASASGVFGGSAGDRAADIASGVSASLTAAVALRDAASTGRVAVAHRATAFLIDGNTANISSGDVVPVPKKTVSPEGTVTTSGYEYITTGFDLTVTGRAVDTGLLLDVSPSISSISSYVGEAPVVARRSTKGQVVVASGTEVAMLGFGAEESRESTKGTSWFQSPGPAGSSRRELVLVVGATRIHSGAVSVSAEPGGAAGEEARAAGGGVAADPPPGAEPTATGNPSIPSGVPQ